MLKYLRNLFKSSKSNKVNLLSSEIAITEKIARSIFSPVNVTKSNTLRANAYKSPANIDEVSVNRLDYTTANFIKKLSKKIATPPKREYFGFAILSKSDIIDCDADVVYSPILEPKENLNIYHSDIKVGFIKEKGQELPAEINYKVSKLIEKSRFYIDPNPNTENWTGDDLK